LCHCWGNWSKLSNLPSATEKWNVEPLV
jgi:hypothetical protein